MKKMICKVFGLFVMVFVLMWGTGAIQGNISHASVKSSYQKVIKKYKRKGFTMFVKYDANCTYNGENPSQEEGYPRLLSSEIIKLGRVKYYDLNGDGKKECILMAGGYLNIFTQKKNKVKYLGGIKQRNDDWICYKKGRKNFVVASYGGRMYQYYVFRIRNGVMKKICMMGDQLLDDSKNIGKFIHEYYYNDKLTSTSKYKKYYKKYVKGVPSLIMF